MNKKTIHFLPIICCLLLSGCGNSQETSLANTEPSPTKFETASPSPEKTPLSTYDDGTVTCQYDDSLLQVSAFSDPIAEVSYGWISSIKGEDVSSVITNGNCLYISTLKFENMDFFNNYPSSATQALFNGLFQIQSDETASVTKLPNGNYRYSLSQSGYNYKGEILSFNNDLLTVLVYRLDEALSPELTYAFNSCYNSIKYQAPISDSELDETSWDYVKNNYPYVTYDDVNAGNYSKNYVIMSSIIDNVDYFDVSDWVTCDAWFKSKNSYVKEQLIFQCEELPNYSPKSLSSGDNIDICLFINSDNSFGLNIKAFNSNDEQITLSEIYDSFKQNCIPIDWESIMRNPSGNSGTTFTAEGKVFQIISDNDNYVELLLAINNNNEYIRISYYYKKDELKILENDTLKIYGTFYKTFDYTSVLGTKRSIPSIVTEFIEHI